MWNENEIVSPCIILQNSHFYCHRETYFRKLVINFYRILVLRNGIKETLNQIRTKFWIPKSRNHVKRVIKKCLVCQRHEGKAFSYPSPPDLPTIRLI